jgi:hypothetical protein
VIQVRVPSFDRPASPQACDGTSRTDRTTWTNCRYALDTVQARAWNDKMYFMPIRLDELNRNQMLKQNPGY